jgi:predicted permease
MRSLPVEDPDSLVVVKWRSRPFGYGSRNVGSEFVLRGISGTFYRDPAGVTGAIFPFPAFELLLPRSPELLSSLFAYYRAGSLNVRVKDHAELASGQYVTGDFFRGLAVSPSAGRLILPDDDRVGAPPVAVVSARCAERRFGGAAAAAGQPVLINNVAFTVIGVTPPEFFGVDPGAAPDVFLPMRAQPLFDTDVSDRYLAPNYYWVQMMGRLRPGVRREQVQAALAAPFAQWVATTAQNDKERANLPALRIEEGAGGLDSLRRQYSQPLFVLLGMVGLILAMACANTANLLLARASARSREMAVRLSIGAGRFRLVRQLLTETVLLASLSGALGVLIALAGIRALTLLLANGREGFTLHAELNWHVLGVTLGLSLLCGLVFGLAPALQSTSPALMPNLKDRSVGQGQGRPRGFPLSLIQGLVVGQVAISLLLLVGAGLFVRTLQNLQNIPLGFNPQGVLLFQMNAPQAGYSDARALAFYDELRNRLRELPGVRGVTLSHESLLRAGTGHSMLVDGKPTLGSRILFTGPSFFTTMQIPILRGREITEADRQGSAPVAVVSELFARTYFGAENPLGRTIVLRPPRPPAVNLEVVGVAAMARYGPLKWDSPPVVYLPYAQLHVPPARGMTFALRTEGDPLRHAADVRQLARQADASVPLVDLRTQAADIAQTINQEIVFARLCSAFAALALVIACVGLYATMAYAVTRRTNEIGIRMALGARRGTVVSMVMGEVSALAALGLAISLPIAVTSSRLLQSFLFDMQPNDPRALAAAVAILLGAALVAGYAPARRASRLDPMSALRND